MNISEIGQGIKDKGIGCRDNGYIILIVFLAILILVGFIKKLMSDISS